MKLGKTKKGTLHFFAIPNPANSSSFALLCGSNPFFSVWSTDSAGCLNVFPCGGVGVGLLTAFFFSTFGFTGFFFAVGFATGTEAFNFGFSAIPEGFFAVSLLFCILTASLYTLYPRHFLQVTSRGMQLKRETSTVIFLSHRIKPFSPKK